jgi:hypothetical protein
VPYKKTVYEAVPEVKPGARVRFPVAAQSENETLFSSDMMDTSV